MSNSLPPSSSDDAPRPADVPARNVPEHPDAPATAPVAPDEELEISPDPVALDADRAGFRFLAIGFAIFFALIAVCASIVALVMKSMGI